MAGSLQDIYNMMLTMTQSLNKLTTVLTANGSIPVSATGVLVVTFATSSTQVVAANQSRVVLTFHNPSNATVWIAPATDANGNAITLVEGSGIALPPYDWVPITGNIAQLAWNGISALGATISVFTQ